MNVLSFNDRMKMMDNYYYFSRGTKKKEKKGEQNNDKRNEKKNWKENGSILLHRKRSH